MGYSYLLDFRDDLAGLALLTLEVRIHGKVAFCWMYEKLDYALTQ